MAPQLTEGICERLFNGDPQDSALWESTPTLQLLSIKKVGNTNQNTERAAVDRYRIILSDGKHFLQAMLATQLNSLVDQGAIVKNTIATIEKMTCNLVAGRQLVILLGIRVEAHTADKIGEPKALSAPNESGAGNFNAPETLTTTTMPKPMMPQRNVQQPRSSKPIQLCPIEALSPYHNNWTIKARVTQKSEIRNWSNPRGEGKLFNASFMDESGDIRGTAFNAAVDALYDKLQEGKVYYISRARVDIAKKKFTNNQYELALNVGTEIEEVTDVTQVPAIKYDFVTLQGLNDIEKDMMCDVIGVVKHIGDIGQIITKSAGKSLTKRELTLVDSSNYSVRLTLWGKQAEQFQASEQDVIAFKSVRVGDFGGRSLSMVSSSVMQVNPDIPQAHILKGWYMDGGADVPFQLHSRDTGMTGVVSRDQMRTIIEAKSMTSEPSDKPEYFSIRATVMNVKPDNLAYPACPTQSCNKKVVEDSSTGQWRCEKCDRSYPAPEYRYMISLAVADSTDQLWIQGFNDAGLTILGQPADDLKKLQDTDEEQFNDQLVKANGKMYDFGIRAKQDTYNDQTRIRYGITRIQQVDYAAEIKSMLTLLKTHWATQ